MTSDFFSVFVATGCSIPARLVPNEEFLDHRLFADYGKPFDPADNPKIISKFREITGILERHYVSDDKVASDLALEAAQHALAGGGIDPESLDYLIVAHNFGDVREGNRRSDFVPSLAARVKRALRIANPGCVAYDLPFGCPGWLQAVIQADYYLRSGDAEEGPGDRHGNPVAGGRPPRPRQHDLLGRRGGRGARGPTRAGERLGILAHAARSDTLDHARLMWMGKSYDPAVRGRPAVPEDARPRALRIRPDHGAGSRPSDAWRRPGSP